MRIKRRCKNCGAVIDMSKSRHYIVKVSNDYPLQGITASYSDAFDCQECGCQYLAGMRIMKEMKENKEEN